MGVEDATCNIVIQVQDHVKMEMAGAALIISVTRAKVSVSELYPKTK